jgi:hypothetical protein
MPEGVRVWLLGGFRVSVGSRTIEEDAWRLRKPAALVKLLALASGHRLHREQVMDLLWPDLGKKAASNNLRQTLHAARKIIAPDQETAPLYLASQGEQLLLSPEGLLWIDVDAFEEAAVVARRSRDPAAYHAALDSITTPAVGAVEDKCSEHDADHNREEAADLYARQDQAGETGGEHHASGEPQCSIQRTFGGVSPDEDEESAYHVERCDNDATSESLEDGIGSDYADENFMHNVRGAIPG